MISYRPSKKPKIPQLPNFLSWPTLLPLVMVLVGGLVIIKMISATVQNAYTHNLSKNEDLITPAYTKHVASESDSAKLATIGNKLMKKQLFAYAALNFKRASDLDPNFRDAAYGWAYTLLEANHNHLTASTLKQLHTAINRTEAIDPFYPPLLHLKITVAQAEGDTATQKIAEQRLKLLTH